MSTALDANELKKEDPSPVGRKTYKKRPEAERKARALATKAKKALSAALWRAKITGKLTEAQKRRVALHKTLTRELFHANQLAEAKEAGENDQVTAQLRKENAILKERLAVKDELPNIGPADW